MKTYYQCEKCGKKFDTKNEAEECEKLCIEKEENAKRIKQEKNDRCKELEELLKKFADDYGDDVLIKELSRVLPRCFNNRTYRVHFNFPWWF